MTSGVSTVPFFNGRTPNRSQALFFGAFPECRERYYIGTPGSGKSLALIAQVIRYCLEFPGSTWLLARWTERETVSVLKGDFDKEAPVQLLGRWDHDESRQWFKNGSSVYIHGLNPSEGQARYGKFAGYSLSGVGLSQVEAIPQDFVERLLERLRSPLPPRLLMVEGNLPGRDHWLYGLYASAREVGERVYLSGPRLIVIGNLDDNESNLPPEYVQNLRKKYPPGHPEHGTRVSGDFGITRVGAPIYGDLFRPDVHIFDCAADPRVPLLEAFDFGFARPAITWSQFQPGGLLRVLGEWMGDGVQLADVILERNRILRTQFPDCKTLFTTADPSGEARRDTGKSSIQFLRDHGISITPAKGANVPAARAWAIQKLGELMGRHTRAGEAFGVRPDCRTLIDGFKGGYIRDPRHPDKPFKDSYFDHLQNCLEYTLVYFAGWEDFTPATDGELTMADLRRLFPRDPGEPPDEDPSLSRRQKGY